ncbi:hypothetical protein CMI37_21995 [Candidatus Pacearchaeota archaeon]|nr:hypothetical protein [Candidatus Pacearchaeota archaeon]
MKKTKVAKTIERFLKKYDLDYDVRIYFSGKCWDYDSSGKKTVIEDIKASDYFEYANDDTISMTFEGPFYEIINEYCGYALRDEWDALDFDGYYMEQGHAWNGVFYKE